MKTTFSFIIIAIGLFTTLFLNPHIQFFGILGVFLLLPNFIHKINIAIRKKLAKKDNFIGKEAKRQLVFFNRKGYRIAMFAVSIILGIVLLAATAYFTLNYNWSLYNDSTKNLATIYFLISSLFTIMFLINMYLDMKKN